MPSLGPSRVQREGRRTFVYSTPAPIGGWNTRDSLDDMPETDAIFLVNLIPNLDKLVLRTGYSSHATGVGSGAVETLAIWGGAASTKLVAAGGGELYDATSVGAASALTAATYTSDRWQTVNFKNRLFGVNGSDAPWDYDGTTVTNTAWTGPTSISDLINVWSFQSRLWFVEKNSASAWYGGAGAVTGTLTAFDLSQVTSRGGHLVAGGNWSRDGGAGLEDLVVFIMSTGEIIVYSGTDPASNFVKVGSYIASPPVGDRCITQVGGDLAIITRAGYIPVSLIMQGWTLDTIFKQTMWGKISKAVLASTNSHYNKWGWQASPIFPNGRVYFNYPLDENNIYEQHVLNTYNGSWTKFEGLNSNCWVELDNAIYFGGGGGVVYQQTGTTDGGMSISFSAKSAFTYLGLRGTRKHFSGIRPVITPDGTITGSVNLDIDFSNKNFPTNTHTFTGDSSGDFWDIPSWDEGEWADKSTPVVNWTTAGGFGNNCSFRFSGLSATTFDWLSVDYLVNPGGLL